MSVELVPPEAVPTLALANDTNMTCEVGAVGMQGREDKRKAELMIELLLAATAFYQVSERALETTVDAASRVHGTSRTIMRDVLDSMCIGGPLLAQRKHSAKGDRYVVHPTWDFIPDPMRLTEFSLEARLAMVRGQNFVELHRMQNPDDVPERPTDRKIRGAYWTDVSEEIGNLRCTYAKGFFAVLHAGRWHTYDDPNGESQEANAAIRARRADIEERANRVHAVTKHSDLAGPDTERDQRAVQEEAYLAELRRQFVRRDAHGKFLGFDDDAFVRHLLSLGNEAIIDDTPEIPPSEPDNAELPFPDEGEESIVLFFDPRRRA